MLSPEELYEGLPKETAEAYRTEALEKYGADAITKSENYLRKLSKAEFAILKQESQEVYQTLFALQQEDPASEKVQREIARHYTVTRTFWGTVNSPDPQVEAYEGLGQLYVHDERFTRMDGKPQPQFALFLSKAMSYFAHHSLK